MNNNNIEVSNVLLESNKVLILPKFINEYVIKLNETIISLFIVLTRGIILQISYGVLNDRMTSNIAGVITAGLNHLAHSINSIGDKRTIKTILEDAGMDPNSSPGESDVDRIMTIHSLLEIEGCMSSNKFGHLFSKTKLAFNL